MSNLTIEELTNMIKCPECGVYYSQDTTCPVCELQYAMRAILDTHKKQLEQLSAIITRQLEETQEA